MIARLAWRNVWRNRLRSGIMIAAMVFGLLGVMVMLGFVQAMVDDMINNAIRYGTGHLQVHHPNFLLNEELDASLPEADEIAAAARNQPGVAGASARQVVDGMVGSPAATRGVRILGVRMADERQVTDLDEALGEGTLLPEEGRSPLLMGNRLGKKLKVKLGSKVVLTFSDAAGEVTGAAFRIRGFFETPSTSFDEGTVFVRGRDLARLTNVSEAHEVVVRLKPGASLEEEKTALAARVGANGVVRDWKEAQPILSSMVGSMAFSNTIVMIVFVVALGFGIVNVMWMSVFERTREFGVLMAVGMNTAKIAKLITLESVFLGGVGALAGMAAGAVLILILGRVGLPFGAMAEGLGAYGVDSVLYPSVPPVYFGTMGLFIFITSVLAAFFPLRRILRKRPQEAMAERQ